MEQSSVLSLDSIDRIRFYVKNKYADLPHEKHAEIVADAIVKIIERQLPEFSPSIKMKITNQLIEQVVVPHKRPVSLEDIKLACEASVTTDEEKVLLDSWKMEKGILTESETITEKSFTYSVQTYWKKIKVSFYYSVASLAIIACVSLYPYVSSSIAGNEGTTIYVETIAAQPDIALMENELPANYQYTNIDEEKLKEYLSTRNSLLTDEPYFSAIIETAQQFNIHPILLFAITGQEQGFVDRDHDRANEIANNPFNVFYSWEDYNTSIEDTVAIAARTIVNLSKERPNNVDAIVWINRKYAEDPNWSTGVKSLFETMINYIND